MAEGSRRMLRAVGYTEEEKAEDDVEGSGDIERRWLWTGLHAAILVIVILMSADNLECREN